MKANRMSARFARGLVVVSALTFACGAKDAIVDPAENVHASSQTADVVSKANAFLASLDTTQRTRITYAFDDAEERKRWSNFPPAVAKRGGIQMSELTDAQRTAAFALLESVLSPKGMEKVRNIMAADDAFKAQDHGGPPQGGPPHFKGPLFGHELYSIAILGTPSERNAWMLQFGGHHLALNITIAGDRGVLTPTLTGAQPASFEVNGKTVRPLGAESDKAFVLLDALDETQRAQAILKYRVSDLVLGPGHDGESVPPEGLKVSRMNAKQRALLLDVISEWAGIENEGYASARMNEIEAGFDDTWFAWSGATTHEPGKNGSAYYRIQGPRIFIEYAPQGLGGDLTMHVHTMFRDPTNDYGSGLAGK